MGKCFSCCKVPPPPSSYNQSTVLEHKGETMEMHASFTHNTNSEIPHANAESQTNGNKKGFITSVSTFNGMGTNNCTSTNSVQNSSRSARGFYSRLQPLGRSSNVSSHVTSDSKQQKEPSEAKINSLFDQYKDSHEDIILEDGIERLCKDLQLLPDDFKILVFAWKLNAQQMYQFTRDEFAKGLKAMKVDCIQGIQQQLPITVEELVENNELFKDLYRFTFRFGLDISSGQRILPADMAIVLWRLVFTIRKPPLLERWLKFLEIHHLRGIPRDTWNMFLNFADSIGDDLATYDDAEAWPSLFDDFVEYENDQMNQNITKDDVIRDSVTEND